MTRAVFALIKIGDRFLSVSRKKEHSKFGFPGGGVEKGESDEQALHRELKEEIHTEGKIIRKLYVDKSRTGFDVATYEVILTSPLSKEVPFINEEGALVALRTAEEFRANIFGRYNGEVFKALDKQD